LDLLLLSGLAAEVNVFPELNELVWTIINFLIILAVLYKFLYQPLLSAITARENEINSALKKAAEDRAEAERLRREFEERISAAQAEAQEIINQAVKNATATKDQIEADARAKASELLENAAKTIELEKAKAIAELREEVAALAIAVASKVIEKNLDTAEQHRLANSFVTEVGKH